MPTKIDFRDCVHHGIAGPTPDHILASIRAEYCLPPSAPVRQAPHAQPREIAIRAEDFSGLERALGSAAFRQLLSDFRRGARHLRDLPDFLAQHRYGRATAALVDLARLELALSVSERAPAARSIGPCCLPPALLRSHPDLTLVFHPAWQWLAVNSAADHWRSALLHDAAIVPPPLPRPTRLRLSPEHGRIVAERLSPALFAFEQALQSGATLRQASDAARHDVAFDPIQSLLPLLMAGAVIDVELHPAHEATTHDNDEVMP
ncbi:hypothetical protein [Dongia deserti]|uniref:hypothetical protein n=1 Tax=Dongia deserti TaxID=2268030 RepID=UPI0013C4F344|nr:hypothetical protein [Dongia deserti]